MLGADVDADGANALAVLDASGLFARSPAGSEADAASFTFHAARPPSVIDWILLPRTWPLRRYEVVASLLSDHRAVVADFEVPNAR